MEKIIFIFRRKPHATRDAFFEHYLSVHAPLGLREKQGLCGYTVNLLESDADFDAVTEIQTPLVAGFGGTSSTRTDGENAIIADHLSFMGPQDGYSVEERIVRDGPLPPLAPGIAAKGVKSIRLFHVGELLPDPAAGADRVVDNVVKAILYLKDQRINRAPSEHGDVAIIRTSWARSSDTLMELPPMTVMVREFRNREVVQGS